MSSIKNTQRILDAIDQLRRRKARPDKKRICNFVSRRHMVSPLEIYNDLERLVDEQTVIKVEYKGNISYRNAAKWAKLSVHKSRVEVELNDLSKVDRLKAETERMTYALRGAISALVVKDKEFLHHGVPTFELEQYLLSKDPDCFRRVSFDTLLSCEVAANNIVKLANGNYSFRAIAATMGLALSPSPVSPAGSEEGTHNENATKDLRTSHNSVEMDQMSEETSAFTDSKMSTSPTQSWQDESSKTGLDIDADADLDADVDGAEHDGNLPSAPSSPTPNPGSSPVHQQESLLYPVDLVQEQDQDHDEQENETDRTGIASTTERRTADLNGDAAETETSSGYRAGERRKRAKKKVFDPSDNNIPKVKKRGRPAASFKNSSSNHDENGIKEKAAEVVLPIPGPVCAFCNAEMKDAKSTSCRDCTKKAHTSCIQKSLKNATKARPGPWQCTLCKTCSVCSQTKEMGTMAVCCLCDEATHVKCLGPRPKVPLKKWVCQQCSPPEPKSAASTPDGSPLRSRGPPVLVPMLPTALPPVGSDMFADLNDCSIDESIPDASEWTSEEVFEYFQKLFPEHATVFREQDIDGRSLLLMSRSDVVNGLSLKLGPALKIYGQVKRLQLRRSERHLLWE